MTRPRPRKPVPLPLIVRVAALSMVVCRRHLSQYSHLKSPRRFTQRQLMTCLVLRALKDETYRGIVELLAVSPTLCAACGLSPEALPHYSTLKRFFDRTVAANPRIVDTLVGEVLAECQRAGLTVDEVAGDATGIEVVRASRHFQLRSGRKGRGRYVQVAVLIAVGAIQPVSVHASFGPDNDLNAGPELVWPATGRCQPLLAYYDRGFDSERFHALHRDGWGVRSVIPPVPKTPDQSVRTPYRASCVDLPRSYGRRWHVESFFSGLKRVCGPAVRAVRPANQLAEAAMKVLAYALRR